ncbi:MAG: M28 family peptidase [Planctomycetota bacterium]
MFPRVSWLILFASLAPVQDAERHVGPGVPAATAEQRALVLKIHGAFDVERAFETIRFTDGYYRAPANEGFDAVIDHVAAGLRQAGFREDGERFQLEILETPRNQPAWTPIRARLEMTQPGGEPVVLHAFDEPSDPDRTMLPINAPTGEAGGRVVLELDDVEKGTILVTEESLSRVAARARSKGAIAVIGAGVRGFNVDPTGQDRHLDAIPFTSVFRQIDLPVAVVSQRTHDRIAAAVKADAKTTLRLACETRFEKKPLRTIVARILGASEPERAIAIASHVQEPGACDNASGVGGTLEAARCLAELIQAGELEPPKRTIVFIIGDEMTQSRIWLDHTRRAVLAAISVDMVGESKEKTGAIALLERTPDPGAAWVLAPDAHTPWGASPVDEDDLRPNGLAVIARSALADVRDREPTWTTREHPWEGGSDHDIFLRKGIPAVLFWHFTDFTYHTSLDRLEMIDPTEVRRTMVAVALTAWRIASPDEASLVRYRKAVEMEQALRLRAANEAESPSAIRAWKKWGDGAITWLEKVLD